MKIRQFEDLKIKKNAHRDIVRCAFCLMLFSWDVLIHCLLGLANKLWNEHADRYTENRITRN